MRSNTIAGKGPIPYFYSLIRHQNIYMRTLHNSTQPAQADLSACHPAKQAQIQSREYKNAKKGIVFQAFFHQKFNAANYPDPHKVGINFANILAGNSYALKNTAQ